MKYKLGLRCKNCKAEIFSEYRHDFKVCDCFKNEGENKGCYIDGGNDYTRVGGSPENYEYIYRLADGKIIEQSDVKTEEV